MLHWKPSFLYHGLEVDMKSEFNSQACQKRGNRRKEGENRVSMSVDSKSHNLQNHSLTIKTVLTGLNLAVSCTGSLKEQKF
jgi:hypothetical protein